jgi:hypothetical protein
MGDGDWRRKVQDAGTARSSQMAADPCMRGT